jgi:hypothetical protein
MLLWVAVGLCFWVEGRERCVDCVCATEPPCSSGSKFGDAGAAAISHALEKNTTLLMLDLEDGEFVVLRCIWGGGLIVVYVVVGCCLFVFFG